MLKEADLGQFSMKLLPNISPEFDELMAFARESRELANAVRDFLEHGLPILVADIDNLATNTAGDRVFTYQLPDRLKVLLATARAGKFDSIDVPSHGCHTM